jgi:hypothetical protein
MGVEHPIALSLATRQSQLQAIPPLALTCVLMQRLALEHHPACPGRGEQAVAPPRTG